MKFKITNFKKNYATKRLSNYSFINLLLRTANTKRWIKWGAEISKLGPDTLINAVKERSTKCVKLLIDAGIDINKKNRNEITALYEATISGYKNIVKLLVENGAKLDIIDDIYKRSLLHEAVRFKSIDIVNILIDANINLDTRDCEGKSALHFAASNGHFKIAQQLINAGISLNLVTEKGYYSETALHNAIEFNHNEIATLLIYSGADLNIKRDYFDSKTAIDIAVENENIDLVRLLMETEPNLDTSRARKTAIDKGNFDIFNLLNNKPRSNEQTKNLREQLNSVIKNNYYDQLDNLLDSGIDVNYLYEDKQTPLQKAVELNNFSIVKKLIKCNADVNLTKKNNDSPIEIALKEGHSRITNLLINSGASTNFDKWDKMTPYHWAGRNGLISVILKLRKTGLDINYKNRRGMTALDEAIGARNKFTKLVLKTLGGKTGGKRYKQAFKSVIIPEYPLKQLFLFIHGEPIMEKNLATVSALGLSICEKLSRFIANFSINKYKFDYVYEPLLFRYLEDEIQSLVNVFEKIDSSVKAKGFYPDYSYMQFSTHCFEYLQMLEKKNIHKLLIEQKLTAYNILIDYGNTIGCGGTIQTTLEYYDMEI